MEKYIGIALIVICAGIMLYVLATVGFNTYVSMTKEKIEVQTENSNFSKSNTTENE